MSLTHVLSFNLILFKNSIIFYQVSLKVISDEIILPFVYLFVYGLLAKVNLVYSPRSISTLFQTQYHLYVATGVSSGQSPVYPFDSDLRHRVSITSKVWYGSYINHTPHIPPVVPWFLVL